MIQKRTVLGLGIALVVVVILGAVTATFSYGITRKQWDGPVTRAFATLVAFPAGKVASQKATYTDYLAQVDAQAVYLQTPDARQRQLPTAVNQQTREAAYTQIIQIAALDQLARENQVSIPQIDIDKAFDDFTAQAGTSTQPGEIDNFLKESFGWNREQFKQFFIRPGVVSQALRAKMPGATEEEKATALGIKIDERLAQPDVKRYLIIAPEGIAVQQ